MRKVLRETIDRFMQAEAEQENARVKYLQCWKWLQRRQLKKIYGAKLYELLRIKYDLEEQTDIYGLFEELAREIRYSGKPNEVMYEILKLLDVEVTTEKCYIEGELQYDSKFDRYVIVNGSERQAINIGDKISIKIKDYWLKSRMWYDENRDCFYVDWFKGELAGAIARVRV